MQVMRDTVQAASQSSSSPNPEGVSVVLHSHGTVDTAYVDGRVAAQDSGKPILDAAFGEVTVTCEKICWLLAEGERWLRPEHRSASRMVRCYVTFIWYHQSMSATPALHEVS